MNRIYTQFRLGLEKRPVDLYCIFAVGASGAPTLSQALSKGVASVVRNAAGKYTITLQDKYVDLLHVQKNIIQATGAPAPVGGMVVRSKAVASATPTIQVEFLDGTGVGVDPNSGATVQLKIELKASTV